MVQSHGTTTMEQRTSQAVPAVHPRSDQVGGERPSRAHRRSRTGAAIGAWLGTSTWPAYCAAGITAVYGLLKAYWVFGGTGLWSIAPLSPEIIDKVRSHTAPTWFVVADAVSMVLAVAGVLFALATVRPRRWLPVRLVRWSLWPLATFMVLRAMLGIIGDVQQIASGESGALSHTALWDLASPVAQIHEHAPPFMLVHGALDSLAAVTDGRAFAQRLRRSSNNPVVYLELPGAEHGFDGVHSPRTEAVINGVHRFLDWARSNA